MAATNRQSTTAAESAGEMCQPANQRISPLIPAPWERVRAQLEAVFAHVDTILIWRRQRSHARFDFGFAPADVSQRS